MSAALWTFNVFAVAMTLLGGMLPMWQNLMSRQGLWRLFALRAGLLLSITFIEVFPDAWGQDVNTAGWGVLSGFVLLFLLENIAMGDSCEEYLENCSVHYLGWAALLALTLHSFIDGFNLSISFSAGTLAGSAVGVALALHKIADGFTLTSLFKTGGFTSKGSLAALLLVSLATPAGSALHAFGMSTLSSATSGYLMGFAAGSFLYIGAADILPRIHRQQDRWSPALFTAGLLSIGILKHFAGAH